MDLGLNTDLTVRGYREREIEKFIIRQPPTGEKDDYDSDRDSARLLGESCWQPKIEWPLGKKIARKSRNSRRSRGGEVGAEGMVTKGAFLRCPGTKYKRSKNAFASTSIALILVPLGTKLLEISAQFLIGSPGTLVAAALTLLISCRFALGIVSPSAVGCNVALRPKITVLKSTFLRYQGRYRCLV